MIQIFGTNKAKPKPNLSDAIVSTDNRIGSIEVKIKKLDAELSVFKGQMAKLRDGPGKVSQSSASRFSRAWTDRRS
jgi:charged multivesicular body protein 5